MGLSVLSRYKGLIRERERERERKEYGSDKGLVIKIILYQTITPSQRIDREERE